MGFNLKTLVPVDTGAEPLDDGSIKPFDLSALVPSDSPEAQEMRQKQEAEKPDFWETTGQNLALEFVDFFMPDEISKIINAGGTQPFDTSNSTPIGHSLANPREGEEMRGALATQVLGADKYKPISALPTAHERASAGSLSALGDPTSWVGKGLWNMAKNAASNLLPAYAGGQAGEVAQQQAQKAGWSEGAQMAVALTAGVSTGITTGVVQTPLAFGVKKTGSALVAVKNNIKNRDKVIDTVSDWGTQKISADVLASQPELPKLIAQAQKMAARLGYPEMKLAHLAPLVANDQLNRDFRTFYNTSTDFKTSVNEAVSEFNTVLEEYTRKFGGNPSAQSKKMINAINSEKKIIKDQQSKVDDRLIEQQHKINDEIAITSEQLFESGDSIESGKKIANLQAAQRKIAQKQLSAEYKTILNSATEQGVEMGPDGVAAMFNLNVESRLSEAFGKGNRVSVLMDKHFKPETIDTGEFHPPKNIEEMENPRPIMEEVYPTASIETIDSLKRETNLLLRGHLDPSQRTTLMELKGGLDEQLKIMDPAFAALYKATDLKYLEDIGLPFNMEGVRSMSAAKFNQDVSKKIMKPEIAQQFLAVAGDEGPDVLRHAILIGLNKVAFKDGILQPKKLADWMDKPDNKLLLGMVDGLEDDLKSKGAYVSMLQENLALVGVQRTEAMLHQTDSLFEALGKNTNKVVTEVLQNATQRDAWFAAIDKMTPDNKAIVLNGLRQSMVKRAMSFAGNGDKTVMEHLRDPQYRPAYIKVFGKEYFKGLEALATIGDSKAVLQLDRIQMGIKTKEKELGREKFGFGLSNVGALWRRQMISLPQKLTILASLTGTKQLQNASDKKLMEFMLSKDFVTQAGKSIEFTSDGAAVLKRGSGEFLMSMMELSGRGAYVSGQQAVRPEEQGQELRRAAR